jgi:ssDNA thymidine ADP-ribosyltransferase, DarT
MRRGITRLCHFTPSRNLAYIMTGRVGILATSRLRVDERLLYNPTDLQRYDGHVDHICCSVEYPNAWYLDQANSRERLFRDWVVLLIDPRYLWEQGTRFCSRNASASHGRHADRGLPAFRAMFAATVTGAYGRTFNRGDRHLECSPTDDQAEVLIPDRVAIQHIKGLVVSSEIQARNELLRFRLSGIDRGEIPLIIAPVLFEKQDLSSRIRRGERPQESIFDSGDGNE